jgi:hypothetical protein
VATLGYSMNVVCLRLAVDVWWMVFLKELPMAVLYGVIVEDLLVNARVRRAFPD